MRNRREWTVIALVCALSLAGVSAYPCEKSPVKDEPYCDRTFPAMERAKLLVDRMTVEEIVPQLLTQAAAIDKLGVEAYNYWSEGLHGVVAQNVTSFPEPIGLGASFNMTLIKQVAMAISTEARVLHNMKHKLILPIGGLTYFAPNINIFRDPRWGRGQETPGEDPFLTSAYGVAFIQGMQGSPEDPFYDESCEKTVACAKHAFAYSLENSDGVDRHHFDANVSQIDWEETYLPAFRASVVSGKVKSVMCSYNAVNGVPTCASRELFTGLVREQWGFDGYVVSDCDAIEDVYATHHFNATRGRATATAINAGVDLDCGAFYLFLYDAYAQGLVTQQALRDAAQRVFTQRFRLGMFDDPSACRYNAIPHSAVNSPEHKALALDAARQSLVLLRNRNNILPLNRKSVRTIAVIGPNSNNPITLLGNYNGVPHHVVTPLEALKATGVRVLHQEGTFIHNGTAESIALAVDAARLSDVVILFLGIDQSIEREMLDRKNLTLPAIQQQLAAALLQTRKPIVLVLINGGPVAIGDLRDRVDAVLEAWYPGEFGGTAIADALFGDFNPGGRLPVTVYPGSYIDEVAMSNMDMRAGPGRTYRFFTGDPVFQFGEGLSYTTFEYSSPVFVRAQQGEPSLGNYSVTVTNTGSREGSDVVLAFVSRPALPSGPRPPIKELFGFERVALQPGASVTITFPLSPSTGSAAPSGAFRIVAGLGGPAIAVQI